MITLFILQFKIIRKINILTCVCDYTVFPGDILITSFPHGLRAYNIHTPK